MRRIQVMGRLGAVLIALCAFDCAKEPTVEEQRASVEQGIAPIVARADRSRSRGDYVAAIELYSQAYERTPWNDRLKRLLAVTHSEKGEKARTEGELPAAENEMRAAYKLYPDDVDFRRNLAVVLLERAQREMDERRALDLIAELRTLAPDLPVPERASKAGFERRMDLAFELIERGQLDSGVSDLELIVRDYPEEPSAIRLLAQGLVRQADGLSDTNNFEAAGQTLDRAVGLYAKLLPCDETRCTREEVRLVHYNRAVAWFNAKRDDLVSKCMDEAKASDVDLSDLQKDMRNAPGLALPGRTPSTGAEKP